MHFVLHIISAYLPHRTPKVKSNLEPALYSIVKRQHCKIISVTGRGGPYSCETSKLPYFLENRLIDSGEVERERERERRKLWGGSERYYHLEGGVTET
jgi:hypothetical protein